MDRPKIDAIIQFTQNGSTKTIYAKQWVLLASLNKLQGKNSI